MNFKFTTRFTRKEPVWVCGHYYIIRKVSANSSTGVAYFPYVATSKTCSLPPWNRFPDHVNKGKLWFEELDNAKQACIVHKATKGNSNNDNTRRTKTK